MTTAAQGVQKALARAGASVIAIAEMSADDLLAQMTDEQKTALSASIAPPAPKADVKPGDDQPDDAKEAEAKKGKEADASAASAADPRVKVVAAAVASDDACKGKADLALLMLADDDYATLSAAGIVKLLGKSTIGAEASGDAEAAARAEMKAALAETTNSGIEANGGGKPDKKQAARSAWDNVLASMNPTKAA